VQGRSAIVICAGKRAQSLILIKAAFPPRFMRDRHGHRAGVSLGACNEHHATFETNPLELGPLEGVPEGIGPARIRVDRAA
jgi:hypothetical protein